MDEGKEEKIPKLTINCADPYHTYIYHGFKPVEGKGRKKKYLDLNKGDIIEFKKNGAPADAASPITKYSMTGRIMEKDVLEKSPELFYAIVVKICQYDTLVDFLFEEGVENCLPGTATITGGVLIYTTLMKTTKEKIDEDGFVGIHVVPIRE